MFEHFGRNHISIKISFNLHLFLSASHFPGIGNHSLTISPSYRGAVTIAWIISLVTILVHVWRHFILIQFFSFYVYLFHSVPCFPRIGNHSLTISPSYCGAVTTVWIIFIGDNTCSRLKTFYCKYNFFILCLSLSHCPMCSQKRQTLSNYLSVLVWRSDYSFGLSALVTMFEHFGRHHISIKNVI